MLSLALATTIRPCSAKDPQTGCGHGGGDGSIKVAGGRNPILGGIRRRRLGISLGLFGLLGRSVGVRRARGVETGALCRRRIELLFSLGKPALLGLPDFASASSTAASQRLSAERASDSVAERFLTAFMDCSTSAFFAA